MVDQKPKIDAMVLANFLVVFILLFIFQDGAQSWCRTRRSRQGTRQDCQVTFGIHGACAVLQRVDDQDQRSFDQDRYPVPLHAEEALAQNYMSRGNVIEAA